MEKKSEFVVLPKKEALENFKDLMWFQYGNAEESENAWKRLQSSASLQSSEEQETPQ